jgi:hypothetical protein
MTAATQSPRPIPDRVKKYQDKYSTGDEFPKPQIRARLEALEKVIAVGDAAAAAVHAWELSILLGELTFDANR